MLVISERQFHDLNIELTSTETKDIIYLWMLMSVHERMESRCEATGKGRDFDIITFFSLPPFSCLSKNKVITMW